MGHTRIECECDNVDVLGTITFDKLLKAVVDNLAYGVLESGGVLWRVELIIVSDDVIELGYHG